MINNYQSRSFSFKSFQRARPASLSVPNSSPIFTPTKKKQSCETPEGHLCITYASPQQYYTNHPKNRRIAHLECQINHSVDLLPNPHHRNLINPKHPQAIFPREEQQHEAALGKFTDSFYLT
jgi:hypothetical protein